MENNYLNNVTLGDCLKHLPNIEDNTVDLFLSDNSIRNQIR